MITHRHSYGKTEAGLQDQKLWDYLFFLHLPEPLKTLSGIWLINFRMQRL